MDFKEGTNLLARLSAGSQTRVELWRSFVRETGAKTVAEIGVWKGEFAAELLATCPRVVTYYMIDPWAHLADWNKPWNVNGIEFEAIYKEAMARTEFSSARRHVLRGTTLDVIDQIADHSLDFAYVDGDHTLKGIATDLIAVLPKMRLGGCIGCDDFTPTIWQHGPSFEPSLVFPFAVHFARAVKASAVALPFNQCLIMLPGTSDSPVGSAGSFVDLTGRYGSVDLLRQVKPRTTTTTTTTKDQEQKKGTRGVYPIPKSTGADNWVTAARRFAKILAGRIGR